MEERGWWRDEQVRGGDEEAWQVRLQQDRAGRQGHLRVVSNPILVLILDFLAFVRIMGGQQRTPGFGIDHVCIFAGCFHIIHDFKAGVEFLGLFLRLIHDLGH